jgi:hypothetical protein
MLFLRFRQLVPHVGRQNVSQFRDRQLRDRQALITLHPNRKKTLTNEVRWCIVGFGALALHIYVSKNPYSGQNARTSCLI